MTDETAPPSASASLAEAVREIERHVATGGWDGPVRVFALVRTARALAVEPGLAGQLPPQVVARAGRDPNFLTSIEQEGLPPAGDLEELLAGLSWPDGVDGAALCVERVILSPAAEQGLPSDPDEALQYLETHPDRQDVRLAVGVLRDGTSWCAVRTRDHDSDDAVAQGAGLIPGLIEAVQATLV